MTDPDSAMCPICSAISHTRRADTPYWICPSCALWFQHPLPPKLYEAAHEAPGDQMSEHDRSVNDGLAGWLVDTVLDGKPGPTLDIGAKWPYLASRLKVRGCHASAMDDGAVAERAHAGSLGITMIDADFETWAPAGASYDLVTMVHSLEHLYRPLDAFRKLRSIIREDGRLFVRLPDHDVLGFERDLTPGHLAIHPFFHCLSSILECLACTDTFVVHETSPLIPGQRDLTLIPI